MSSEMVVVLFMMRWSGPTAPVMTGAGNTGAVMYTRCESEHPPSKLARGKVAKPAAGTEVGVPWMVVVPLGYSVAVRPNMVTGDTAKIPCWMRAK